MANKPKQALYRPFFLHADIAIMSSVLVVLIVTVFMQAMQLSSVVCWAAGMVAFMFSEYMTHRFLFHLKAPKNRLFLKLLKRLHYDHHTYPTEMKLMFLPVWYSLPNLAAFAALFYLVFVSIDAAVAFAAGLVMMLLIYEWKHYIAHRPIQPATKFGRWIKRTHLLHHYKNENYWYGVSTPFVDVLFGTLKNEKEVQLSETVKDLERRGQRIET